MPESSFPEVRGRLLATAAGRILPYERHWYVTIASLFLPNLSDLASFTQIRTGG